MSIILFILILGVLIFVHELGHFLIAKKSGIRVDEFAIGFPPKLFSFKKNGTKYALNLIPFGGYVKIFGENPDEVSLNPDAKDSFVNKSKWIQGLVIVAGVLFNVIFAWLLLSISFTTGFPSIVTDDNIDKIENVSVAITSVLPDSPAMNAGLRVGDRINALSFNEITIRENLKVEDVQDFIAQYGKNEITLEIKRGDNIENIKLIGQEGIVNDKPAIGITMDFLGELKLPIHEAFWEGTKITGNLLKDITIGLGKFIGQAVSGKADLNAVAGPIGIVNLVGDASEFGITYLLGFTAFISLNLAVLNLVPFPALDGGRLLFIIIEGVTRKQIKPKVANVLNATGFAILILLMVVITISDVIKLF